MPTKQRSAPEVSTGSQTGIAQEDDIVECTSDTENPNNGEDDKDQTPPLGRGTTGGRRDDDGTDSNSSNGSCIKTYVTIFWERVERETSSEDLRLLYGE